MYYSMYQKEIQASRFFTPIHLTSYHFTPTFDPDGHASAAGGTWYETITTERGINLSTSLWQNMPLMSTAN